VANDLADPRRQHRIKGRRQPPSRTGYGEPRKSPVRHGEWSELGSRDIDHTTRGARVRERDAIESIRPSIYAKAAMGFVKRAVALFLFR
jgi:hypothetical protein